MKFSNEELELMLALVKSKIRENEEERTYNLERGYSTYPLDNQLSKCNTIERKIDTLIADNKRGKRIGQRLGEYRE